MGTGFFHPHRALLAAFLLPLLASAMGGPEEGKEPFVQVPAFAKANGFGKPRYEGEAVHLANRWNRLTLHADSRRASLNGVQLLLNVGVIKDDNGWRLDKAGDVRKTLQPLLQPMEYLGARRAGVIVLDPGHGGTDTGCHGARLQHEKDLALEITRQVFLDLVLQGYQVLMTRTGDSTLTLADRSARASEWQADLFVSIHLNSSPGREARGVETYVLALPGYHSTNSTPEGEADGRVNAGNGCDEANILLGYALHAGLAQAAGHDRGLRRARFQVLRDAPCPAALVECGYLTNAEEEALLVTPAYREKLGKAIAKGIHEYCGQVLRGRLAAGAAAGPAPVALARPPSPPDSPPADPAPSVVPATPTLESLPAEAPRAKAMVDVPFPGDRPSSDDLPAVLPLPPRRAPIASLP